MPKWIKDNSSKLGLSYYEHDTEKIGASRSRRLKRYYRLVFKHPMTKKTVTDYFGWESDFKGGKSEIEHLAQTFKTNRKLRQAPCSYKEYLIQRERRLTEESEAERKAKAEEERLNRIVFSRVFDESLFYKPDNEYKRNTILFYNRWLKGDLGSKRLDEIKLLDLQRIEKRMRQEGRAEKTIKTIKEIVRPVYTYARRHELYFGSSPTEFFLEGQKISNAREAYYSPIQANQLLVALKARSIHVYRIALISLNTGMRFGEIAALRWQDISIENETIYIAKPKNGEARTVQIVPAVREVFIEMRRGKKGELIFPDKNGNVMGKIPNTFPRVIDSLGFNEGVTDRRQKLTFHSLRHTTASWLAIEGYDIRLIAEVLGHKTLQMSMRYSKLNSETIKKAMTETLCKNHDDGQGEIIPLRAIA
ncbi:tyrosine-type recombinase/integrase [Desulfosediminicola ganghwensis]|uniref:tyrosine-type recombinase/integrase n=1 Tax=Desulfosediminicola ganghwensis TaxID=2569540 RepID=UPI0010AB798A|nr:site-specific integrase [Desulfosediminicola ganghwensis]